jgi:hypothetical protein
VTAHPWPATLAQHEHEWDPLVCAVCGEAFAAVASFDAERAGVVPLVCSSCSGWGLVKCSRCHRQVGATSNGALHLGPLVYCLSCSSNDRAAAARREQLEAQRAAAQESGNP